MNSKVTQVFANLALLLGITHIGFGIVSIKPFNLQLIRFLGAGVAMIVTALANLAKGNVKILRIQNSLMSAFIIVLLIKAPQPQVFMGLILFSGLLTSSFISDDE